MQARGGAGEEPGRCRRAKIGIIPPKCVRVEKAGKEWGTASQSHVFKPCFHKGKGKKQSSGRVLAVKSAGVLNGKVSSLLLFKHNGGREMEKNRRASGKYLISSSITSANGNSMPGPEFWLAAGRVTELWGHPTEPASPAAAAAQGCSPHAHPQKRQKLTFLRLSPRCCPCSVTRPSCSPGCCGVPLTVSALAWLFSAPIPEWCVCKNWWNLSF